MLENVFEQKVDHIASSTRRCGLTQDAQCSPYIVSAEGYCVAVRALDHKEVYNQLECVDGTFETISKEDVLVGVLGERQALKGYSGRLPYRIRVGDVLNVLNMGGIIGECTSDHPDLGPALRVEVLGAALVEHDGKKHHARIQDYSLPPIYSLDHSAPIVLVSGTSMNTGKTLAACEIVSGLTARGFRVAAGKATGAALRRDVRNMSERGAVGVASFSDLGVVASTNKQMAPFAKGLVKYLNDEFQPDVIVLELGDGFIGYYGVDELLLDKELQKHVHANIVAATDLAGVWSADQQFRLRYDAKLHIVTGPVTDNAVGKQYIEQVLGITAINAMQNAPALNDRLAEIFGEAPDRSGMSEPRREGLAN
ncbi:MAG: DUF1611 domain-containing protein [Gammaproteobacteria bacterium]|nr:DUF1611 domain-containing protein [Gammaproteobacteria bacterium]